MGRASAHMLRCWHRVDRSTSSSLQSTSAQSRSLSLKRRKASSASKLRHRRSGAERDDCQSWAERARIPLGCTVGLGRTLIGKQMNKTNESEVALKKKKKRERGWPKKKKKKKKKK